MKFLFVSLLAALAQEPTPEGQDDFEGDAPEPTPIRRQVNREKKAEGTPARDRFEAETVIKSRYGSLDVDPD